MTQLGWAQWKFLAIIKFDHSRCGIRIEFCAGNSFCESELPCLSEAESLIFSFLLNNCLQVIGDITIHVLNFCGPLSRNNVGGALIDNFYSRGVTNPVHLTVDTGLGNGQASIKACVYKNLSLGDQPLAAQFQEFTLELRMVEAERVGCM